MIKTDLKAVTATTLVAAAISFASVPAYAGDGKAVGAGLLGFGVGAIVGSALTPRNVYVAPPPPPPPPAYHGPVAYAPPPWTRAWYRYCRSIHGANFDSRSGYVLAADGGWYFCQ